MNNVHLIRFRDISNSYGHLTPIEAERDIPFEIKRVYYINRVPKGVRRGFHSHRDLQQVLICVSGTVSILVKTPFEEKIVVLDDPSIGLFIGPMIWREMYDFSEGSALLVLASEHYDESDYFREYVSYEEEYRRTYCK